METLDIEDQARKRPRDINEHDKKILVEIMKNYHGDEKFDVYMKKEYQNIKKKGRGISRTYPRFIYKMVYEELVAKGEVDKNENIEKYCKITEVRENSGVLVFTLVMSPYPNQDRRDKDFTCEYDCYYCPKYPDMPRSYIADEPAVSRAAQNDWDPIKQIFNRLSNYRNNGINMSNGIKAEIILEGGTYNSYPINYRTDFIHKIYYAANCIKNDREIVQREMYSMNEEQRINESAFCKVVGMSIETRPDKISIEFIEELRLCGVTRVQLGIQHTDDNILRKINRGCYLKDTRMALGLLKNTGFKIAIHIMPDLPNSSYERDEQMFEEIVDDYEISFDYIKIYPVMVTDYTVIKKWYDSGKYKPYSETSIDYQIGDKTFHVNPLVPLIAKFQTYIPYWVRNERTIRDFPGKDRAGGKIIFGGCNVSNLRQQIDKFGEIIGKCRCIRCREIKTDKLTDNTELKLITRTSEKHFGTEYFISFEDINKDKIYGFCRLRLPFVTEPEILNCGMDEIKNAALIRELHVYGKMNSVGNDKNNYSAQHRGLGSKLLQEAENISKIEGFSKIAVISAVGTKNYYRKFGYKDGIFYQYKNLPSEKTNENFCLMIIVLFLFVEFMILLAKDRWLNY